MPKLPIDFYQNEDVVECSQQLLGKYLVTQIEGDIVAGQIIETEAYQGATDKASHAYGNRRTQRTETMFAAGGVAYIYLCYGIHHLFNVVTGPENLPHAVLIRALAPTEGIPTMLKRRKMRKKQKNLTNGPGTLSQALGISTQYDRTMLTGDLIWIEDRGYVVSPSEVQAGPRIGIEYAKEHAQLPWRFILNLN